MKTIASVVLLCALLLSASIAAQGPRRGRGAFPPPGAGFGPGVDLLRVEPLDLLAPVVGVPYSADTLTEVTQVLADGNRIEQRVTGSIVRDGSGRIRREQTLAGLGGSRGEVRIVTIVSPADRVQYRLDEERKIAWRLRLPPSSPRRGGGAGRQAFPARPDMKTEPLEPIQIEGVKAEGTRTVVVIPVGSIGNERTIEVVNERWYSPELHTVVQTRRVDPRFGEVTFKLVNIVRDEPRASVFEVPAGFTVQEQRPFRPHAR